MYNKKVMFDGAGFKAEQLAVQQFGGKLTSLKKHQYKDIDAFIPNRKGTIRSVSIKDQLWSSKKFGGIQLETRLTDTRTGKQMAGCFNTNKSCMYFWRIWTEEYGDTWFIVPVKVLKEYVRKHLSTVKRWSTNPNTESKNRSYNRTYDRAEGFTLMVKDIVHLGQLKPVTTA